MSDIESPYVYIPTERNELSWYHHLMIKILSQGPIPFHIGFIMDGNRRFAKKSSGKAIDGHKMGFSSLLEVLECCVLLGVKVVTVYAFSLDNFNRSEEEVVGLMGLAKDKLTEMGIRNDVMTKYQIRVNIVGDLGRLSPEVQDAFKKAQDNTKHHTRAQLNICFGYVGGEETVHGLSSAIETYRQMLCKAQQKGNSSVLEKLNHFHSSKHSLDSDLGNNEFIGNDFKESNNPVENSKYMDSDCVSDYVNESLCEGSKTQSEQSHTQLEKSNIQSEVTNSKDESNMNIFSSDKDFMSLFHRHLYTYPLHYLHPPSTSNKVTSDNGTNNNDTSEYSLNYQHYRCSLLGDNHLSLDFLDLPSDNSDQTFQDQLFDDIITRRDGFFSCGIELRDGDGRDSDKCDGVELRDGDRDGDKCDDTITSYTNFMCNRLISSIPQLSEEMGGKISEDEISKKMSQKKGEERCKKRDAEMRRNREMNKQIYDGEMSKNREMSGEIGKNMKQTIGGISDMEELRGVEEVTDIWRGKINNRDSEIIGEVRGDLSCPEVLKTLPMVDEVRDSEEKCENIDGELHRRQHKRQSTTHIEKNPVIPQTQVELKILSESEKNPLKGRVSERSERSSVYLDDQSEESERRKRNSPCDIFQWLYSQVSQGGLALKKLLFDSFTETNAFNNDHHHNANILTHHFPALLVRTSGERRLSDFLSSQVGVCQIQFIDTLWPDITHFTMFTIILEYQRCHSELLKLKM